MYKETSPVLDPGTSTSNILNKGWKHLPEFVVKMSPKKEKTLVLKRYALTQKHNGCHRFVKATVF